MNITGMCHHCNYPNSPLVHIVSYETEHAIECLWQCQACMLTSVAIENYSNLKSRDWKSIRGGEYLIGGSGDHG